MELWCWRSESPSSNGTSIFFPFFFLSQYHFYIILTIYIDFFFNFQYICNWKIEFLFNLSCRLKMMRTFLEQKRMIRDQNYFLIIRLLLFWCGPFDFPQWLSSLIDACIHWQSSCDSTFSHGQSIFTDESQYK